MVSNLVPLLICVDDGDTIGALTDRVAKGRRLLRCGINSFGAGRTLLPMQPVPT